MIIFSTPIDANAEPLSITTDLYHIHTESCDSQNPCLIPTDKPIGIFEITANTTDLTEQVLLIMYVNTLYDIDTDNIRFTVNDKLCSSNTFPIDKCGKYTVIPVLSDNFSCEPLTMDITNIDKMPPELISAEYNISPDRSCVHITVSAIDSSNDDYCSSGLHEFPYSFDSGENWTENSTFTFNTNGNYVIALRDKLGNTSYYDINIDNLVDKEISPPTVTPSPVVTQDSFEEPTDSPSQDTSYDEGEGASYNETEDEYDYFETNDSLMTPTVYPSVIPPSDTPTDTIASPETTGPPIISPSFSPSLSPSTYPSCTSSPPALGLENADHENSPCATPSKVLTSGSFSAKLESLNTAPLSYPTHKKTFPNAPSWIRVIFISIIPLIVSFLLIIYLLRGRVFILNLIENNRYKYIGLLNIDLTNDIYEITISDEIINNCTTGKLMLVFSPFFLLFHKNTSINVYLPNKQSYTVTAALRSYIELKL